jgi:hypothetical protein
MDNVILINILIIFIGLTILVLSLLNFTYGLAAWLVLFPIIVSIKGFEGLEIFPMERIFNTLLFGVALIKIRGNWHKIPGSSLFVYYLVFLFVIFLAAIFSDMPFASLARTLTFIVPLMMGVMVLAAVMEKENSLQVIMRAMIIGLAIVIGFAIVELMIQKNLLLRMGVLPWDEDYMSEVRFGISGRISSFVGQPIYAALYMFIMLPIVLFYNKYYNENYVIKLIYLFFLILSIIIITLTGSRSVMIPLAMLPLVLLIFRHGKKVFKIKWLYCYVIGFLLLPFYLPKELLNFIVESFQDVTQSNLATTSALYTRLALSEFFYELFKEHVFFGFGPGFIQKMAANVGMFWSLRGMENQYAALLVESGVIGFLAFMIFLYKAIRMSVSTCRDKDSLTSDWAIMTSSIFSLVMVIALSLYIVNTFIMNYLMIYLAILISLKAQSDKDEDGFASRSGELSTSRRTESGAVLSIE